MKEFVVAVSLTSAFLLALRDIFGRMAMRGVDPVVGTGATAFLGLPVLVAVSLFRGDFSSSPFVGGWPLGAIALAGVLRIVLARTFLFSAMKRIGSARASSLGSTNTFFAILLGIFFLGEELTLLSGGGAVLVILGCVLLTRSRGGDVSGGAMKDFVLGVGLALLSGLSFGMATAMAKTVVVGFASPNYANLYANTIAVLVYFPLLKGKGARTEIRRWSPRTWGLLFLAGSCASMGVTFTYLALANAPLIFVSPLAQSRSLFVVLISWLFLQAHEAVNVRVAAGAGAVVAGTAMLIIWQ